jgi:hypothetical protein
LSSFVRQLNFYGTYRNQSSVRVQWWLSFAFFLLFCRCCARLGFLLQALAQNVLLSSLVLTVSALIDWCFSTLANKYYRRFPKDEIWTVIRCRYRRCRWRWQ